MQGTWVQSLVRELKSHIPQVLSAATKTQGNKEKQNKTHTHTHTEKHLESDFCCPVGGEWLFQNRTSQCHKISWNSNQNPVKHFTDMKTEHQRGWLSYLRLHSWGEDRWYQGCMSVAQSCLTLCHPRDCSPPGSSVHGILQARILGWVAISFFRGSSWPRDWTWVSNIAGRLLTVWATRKPNAEEGSKPRLTYRHF